MIEIIKSGLYDSIQDLGRMGVRQFGVPVSGVMDVYCAKLANALLDNDEESALLEFNWQGPQLKFHLDTYISISGANCNPSLNVKPIKNNQRIRIRPGDVLTFGKCDMGFRGYIAVAGGFQSDKVMGSRSMYKHVTDKPVLLKGDMLQAKPCLNLNIVSRVSIKVPKSHFRSKYLDVMPGIEFGKLSKAVQKMLFQQKFTVANASNRMAYQCNETVENDLQSIITTLVLPGTVQLTPSGELMILMRDCQTTGGYPRIFQLSESSINRLAQKKTGDEFRFKMVNKF